MSNKRFVIDTLLKKRAELEAERERKWAEITVTLHEIDDALAELGEYLSKEHKLDPVYDDEKPGYIKSSSVED